jgi:hypothetical protein
MLSRGTCTRRRDAEVNSDDPETGDARITSVFKSPFPCCCCGTLMIVCATELNCKECPFEKTCVELKEKWYLVCPRCGHTQVDFVIHNEVGSFLMNENVLN